MAPKKKVTKKVKMMDDSDDEASHRALAKLGGLPPAENDEDGIVARDVDVLSEVPEIDTTRAEDMPRAGNYCCISFLVCLAIPLVGLLVAILASGILFASHQSTCSVYQVLDMLSRFNASELENAIQGLYLDCRV
jgi:hypothetical protein